MVKGMVLLRFILTVNRNVNLQRFKGLYSRPEALQLAPGCWSIKTAFIIRRAEAMGSIQEECVQSTYARSCDWYHTNRESTSVLELRPAKAAKLMVISCMESGWLNC